MRLRAPAADREVLVVPGFARIPELVARNRLVLDAMTADVGGVPQPERRRQLRAELNLDAAAPLLLTGHQPELMHPGVWAKNFALAGLARRLGGIALNLVADTDTPKSPAIRVPVWNDDPAAAKLVSVPFDAADDSPYESRGVRDAALFDSFPERVAELTRNWPYQPLLPAAWEIVRATPGTVGEKFTAARRHFERKWGFGICDIPVSRVAKTAAFAAFAGHIAAELPRFRDCYNRAIRDYRRANRVRSRTHPAPDLAEGELPFWDVSADGRKPATRVSASLRPRAMTLTLFARLFLGDLFVHGIGGGKYDEVTDTIAREFFGFAPPGYAVVTATLYPPLPAFPNAAADVRRLNRDVRDLHWNPHRDAPARRAEVVAAEPDGNAARRAWFQSLRALADGDRPAVARRLAEAKAALGRAERERAADAALRRRDLPWVLYPETILGQFLRNVAA